jgi:hypothetical protein
MQGSTAVGEPGRARRVKAANAEKQNEAKGEAAQAIAIEALSFVASDAELLPRFLALTGIEPAGIRIAAREPGFLAGVLQFICAHEPTLLKFAEAASLQPAAVSKALRALPSGDSRYDMST